MRKVLLVLAAPVVSACKVDRKPTPVAVLAPQVELATVDTALNVVCYKLERSLSCVYIGGAARAKQAVLEAAGIAP